MAEVAYIGGYTPDTGGSGPGITLVELGGLTRLGTTPAPGPSFLAAHPRLPVVYAVEESERGTVGVFARAADGGLTPLARHSSGGASPCHLAVDPTGTRLAVANYGDGTVSVHGIDDAGLLTDVWTFPHREGTHAHQAVFGPDGVLYVTDLGADEVRRYLPTGDGVVAHPGGPVRLAPGMGPRHMARAGGHWYVAGELDGTVRAYDTGWREVLAVPASGTAGENHPSHLEAHDGFVYVANRGPDTISVFTASGLERVAEVSCGGVWPRHFAVVDGRVYVANQRSGTVVVLPLKDGVPQAEDGCLAVGTPSCVLPLTR
ncbi:6-phosphogluconolactonase (cycloisomerase 2 family) [Streptosporangium becharense]|uniref:6-phosphogluconolactonase (Cycloisomerase 2 family) n=1 Tax=Streptosporangium becharense TaxID=1816182 RepID=A0A7W9ICZ5_9ACTN|nr:beta-propeller fold lactonase family protein [Streptosporangium becharense]MBB2912768.1 6-phosphogluconolactonase (cycloisomerase 2 family) [Streptosporangium becharense]MBB5818407.1 6-phosphogluconolactonase (cycloisomerase 2 family) [Streptosporangium becharense]